VVTVMDEETGEESTKTIWVDEDGNEIRDSAPAFPEKIVAPIPASKAPAKAAGAVKAKEAVAAPAGAAKEADKAKAAAKPAVAKKAATKGQQAIGNFFMRG